MMGAVRDHREGDTGKGKPGPITKQDLDTCLRLTTGHILAYPTWLSPLEFPALKARPRDPVPDDDSPYYDDEAGDLVNRVGERLGLPPLEESLVMKLHDSLAPVSTPWLTAAAALVQTPHRAPLPRQVLKGKEGLYETALEIKRGRNELGNHSSNLITRVSRPRCDDCLLWPRAGEGGEEEEAHAWHYTSGAEKHDWELRKAWYRWGITDPDQWRPCVGGDDDDGDDGDWLFCDGASIGPDRHLDRDCFTPEWSAFP
jgi:hypothetical protein